MTTPAAPEPSAVAAAAAPPAATPKQRCIILLNHKAGALHGHASVEEMSTLAEGAGLDAEIISTNSPDETRKTLRRLVAQQTERVAVAGGDGTVALAVQELAYTNTALGIIPQGTANNFATALRLPQDLPSALRVLASGTVRAVDLGKIGDRYFTESAGVGLFADALTIYGAKTNKNVLRAFYALVRVFFSARARRLHLTVDGERIIERAVLCEVANTYRMAYAIPVAPDAKVTDGALDIVVVGDLKPGEFWSYYKAFRAQMHSTLPKVHTFKAREVRIETRHTMNVHCDDKVVGTTPVTITSQPAALKVIVDTL